MMNTEKQIFGLTKLASWCIAFLEKSPENYNADDTEMESVLQKSKAENPWFTIENQRFSLKQWADLLTEKNIENWLKNYRVTETPKKVGLILAGNIPMVGFHDVVSVVLSGNIPVIKLSSKDRRLIPLLLRKWDEFSGGNVIYEIVEKLENFDAVIATGSNNTAKYLEFYFKDHLSIIRKNRTSIAVLKGDETDEQLKRLAKDIFMYFGMGCRNVTRIFVPKDFKIDRLFENFLEFKDVINHHSYANNYDYNRAVYLLNQDKFWDNNFVMLKEDDALFSPLAVINFSRYKDLDEVKNFIKENAENIQCIVADAKLGLDSEDFGEAQKPGLSTYADNVDTMSFLEVV